MNDPKLEFITAQLRSEHSDWTNARVFETAMAQTGHQGTFGRDSLDKSTKLVAEASGLDVHPKLKTELNKHAKLEKAKQSAKTLDHVKRLAKIRQLMENDPSLSFDSAFTRIVQEENASPALKTAQSAANGNGKLMLIEGGYCNFFVPLPGVNGQS
jgi:hypothetical protein